MLKHEKKQYKKVVLAYSGGLDTSTIVPWLKENYGCEVVCFVADVGQEREDLDGIEDKAKASGATKCIVKDLREEFVIKPKPPVQQSALLRIYAKSLFVIMSTRPSRPVLSTKAITC